MSWGGRLMIAEPMAATGSAELMGDDHFGFYLWAMGSGRPRTIASRAMLREAGFTQIREVRTDLPLTTRVLSTIR